MLRPRPARWFTLLCGNAELAAVLETLARTQGVETVATGESNWHETGAVRDLLDDYAALQSRFTPYWPDPQPDVAPRGATPLQLAHQAITVLRDWERVAGSLVEELVRLT